MATPEYRQYKVSDNEWLLEDCRVDGTFVASATRVGHEWLATLHPKLCAEQMNFLTCMAATPELAFVGVLAANVRLARDIARALQDIDRYMEYLPDDREKV